MKRTEKILIIEDDPSTLRVIKTQLEMEGFEVHVLRSGVEALERYFDSGYDLVILGWMHNSLPGIEICRQIRISDQHTPIIMLSARRGEEAAIQAFEAGCDDFITTPFCIRELSARVKAKLQIYRRAKQKAYGKTGHRRIEIDGLVIDSKYRRVTVKGVPIDLTAKEYDLLHLLASNPGMVFSRRLLLDLLWDYNADVFEHTVNSHINRLRGKIEQNPGSPKYILTQWGIGYRFAELES
ncbi:MAG: response regulator transcription factor [bacterium]|nr:MAG: response regulator transcription factor [bacterium]